MKRFAILFALLVAVCGCTASAQHRADLHLWVWPSANTTGPVGYNATTDPQGVYIWQQDGPSTYVTVDWTVAGTVTACTFRIEGSSDGVTWDGLDVASPAADATPCTSSNKVVLQLRPAFYTRINIISFTGTGSVVFHYTGGKSGQPNTIGCADGVDHLPCTLVLANGSNSIDLSAQTANLGSTTLLANAVAGHYKVRCSIALTGVTSSTWPANTGMPLCQVSWTDPDFGATSSVSGTLDLDTTGGAIAIQTVTSGPYSPVQFSLHADVVRTK